MRLGRKNLVHLYFDEDIRDIPLGSRPGFPLQGDIKFINFEYGYFEKERTLATASNDRYLNVLRWHLMAHYPAWHCHFDTDKHDYYFVLFDRSSIRLVDGYVTVRIGHPEDFEHASYLAAEILYYLGITQVEVKCKDAVYRADMKDTLRYEFGIKTEGVQTKPIKRGQGSGSDARDVESNFEPGG